MADGDRPATSERPRLLQPQQSAIRLRRPSNAGRPSRPSAPPLPPLDTDVMPQRPPPARRRAATTSAQEGLGAVWGRDLASVPVEVPRESQEVGDGSQETWEEDDEKAERRGMLSRLRWRSDTNLHAAAQPGGEASERRGEQSVDEDEYNDQIVNLLDAIGEWASRHAILSGVDD